MPRGIGRGWCCLAIRQHACVVALEGVVHQWAPHRLIDLHLRCGFRPNGPGVEAAIEPKLRLAGRLGAQSPWPKQMHNLSLRLDDGTGVGRLLTFVEGADPDIDLHPRGGQQCGTDSHHAPNGLKCQSTTIRVDGRAQKHGCSSVCIHTKQLTKDVKDTNTTQQKGVVPRNQN